MQNRRNQFFALLSLVIVLLGIGLVHAATVRVIGFFGEIHGAAYWQNDARKTQVKDLDELKENSKLVLLKGSKLEVLYLESGQQYELNGPGLVQFTASKPVALSGAAPKKIGTAPAMSENKIHVDNKDVQTAGKTLVSTDRKTDPESPIVASAPPPPPPPPPAAYTPSVPVMAAPVSNVAASAPTPAPVPAAAPAKPGRYESEQQAAAEAYAARQAEMAAASQAETEVATARRAEAEAAARARQTAEADAAANKDKGCQPVESDPEKDGKTSEPSTKTVDGESSDCPMITF